ncbi:MAG TPA: SDR family oxidoreductase [Candidatus Eisenbacteria bacterium]|nr:SDR family oxidoreductase [Candidatus Eisenbacteria bacterium]
MGDFSGKVAVVTGGNRGIGRGIASALAQEGATVALTSRTASTAEKAAREIGSGALGFACDVRRHDQVAALFGQVEQRCGGTDILINNAGIGVFGPAADMSPEDWHAVIDTNLSGVFYCCREAIPQMRRRGGGDIINISSLAGKNPIAGGAAYNASKFGLNGFSEALMMEVRYDGIRVSYVMPGSVATEFGRGSTAKQGWALTAEDVARGVMSLLRAPRHALFSRIEMRPSQPPRKS